MKKHLIEWGLVALMGQAISLFSWRSKDGGAGIALPYTVR